MANSSKDTKGGRCNRQLSGKEIAAIRDGVEFELKGYVNVTCDNPLMETDYEKLPPRGPDDDWDMLSPAILKAICDGMINNVCAVETAAQAVGIPPDLARDYADRGCEDLRNGLTTRMAFFAVFVNRIEGKVKQALIQGVKCNPLGWLNAAWLLERQWAPSFSMNQQHYQKAKTASIGDDLNKQLQVAREVKQQPLPTLESIDGTV